MCGVCVFLWFVSLSIAIYLVWLRNTDWYWYSDDPGSEALLLAEHERPFIWRQSADCDEDGVDGPGIVAFCLVR